MVKNLPARAGDVRGRRSIPGLGDPLEKGMAATPVFLPGESHGQRSLAGYGPWGQKERLSSMSVNLDLLKVMVKLFLSYPPSHPLLS